MKYINTTAMLETLTVGENPRLITNLNLASLRDNIEGIGLLEPITVWEPEKGIVQVIRGHRRRAAIELIRAENPKRFGELFGKGVPVLMVKEVTADEVVSMKLDHSEQRGLTDPHELQRSANMLFAIGKTESEVALQLSGLIDKISPMKSKARVELDVLQQKLITAKGTGNAAAITLAEREIRDYIGAYRRGFVQNLHNTYRCPDVVMSALYAKATGMKPEGVTEYLPKIGATEVTALWKAHKADLELKEGGVPIYSKQRPGPAFKAKWDEYIAKEQAEIAEGKVEEPRAKAMSAKEMEAEVKDGTWKSALACKLTDRHCGKAKEDLSVLDNEARCLDLIKVHDKVLFETVMKAGATIVARLVQKDNEAKAKEVAPVTKK